MAIEKYKFMDFIICSSFSRKGAQLHTVFADHGYTLAFTPTLSLTLSLHMVKD